MATVIKEEIFEITQDTPNIIETNGSIAAGEGMQVLWDYEVPVGVSLVFTSEDHFAAYLVSTGTTQVGTDSPVDVVLSDASRVAIRPLLFQIRYDRVRGSDTTFLAFADKDYFNYLDILPGEPVIAREGESVLIRANGDGAIDTDITAACYFRLTCKRIRHTLFE